MADDITTRFHEAATPAMTVDPYSVLAGGRRRRRRRVAAAGSIVAALAVAAVLAVNGLGAGRQVTLPAATSSREEPSTSATRWTLDMAETALAEMNLTTAPDPGYFLDVDATLASEGLQIQGLLRWSGSGNMLTATGYLPELGAGITILTTHRDQGALATEDHCQLLGGDPSSPLVQPPADRCATTRLPDGVLVTVDASSTPIAARDPQNDPLQTPTTQAVFDIGAAVVSVTTWVMDTPAATKVSNPHPVGAATLARLAQDPRMRW